MDEINGLSCLIDEREETKILENENSESKIEVNSVKPIQLQRSKEPSEIQQVYVRKLMMTIQTLLDDFATSKQKCKQIEKEELLAADKIEKAQQNIGRLPKVDSPEYIRLKKLRWEQKIALACNHYTKTMKQFQTENEGFVNLLKLFQKDLKRVLNGLVAVQPLPESIKNKIREEKKLLNLDASVAAEASRQVKKIILKPLPETGINKPMVQLSTMLEDKTEADGKKECGATKKMETEIKQKSTTVIEIVPPSVKTDNQGITETITTKPVVLSAWQKRLREKYNEEALNPLLPENAVVVIYTDGSLISTNKNTEEKIESGGYAAILTFCKMDNAEIVISGHKARPSSSDYMELLAISKALKRLRKYHITGKIVLYSDAFGIVDKYNTKLAGWKDCGWKRADGKYIRYWKLWKKVWKYSKKLDLRVCWVKGHAESKLNKRCDTVARAEARLRAI